MGKQTGHFRNQWYRGETNEGRRIPRKVTYPSRAQILELAIQLTRRVPGHVIEFAGGRPPGVRATRDELFRSMIWDPGQRTKRIYFWDLQGGEQEENSTVSGPPVSVTRSMVGVRILGGSLHSEPTLETTAEIDRISLCHLDLFRQETAFKVLNWVMPMLTIGSILVCENFSEAELGQEEAVVDWMERTGTELVLLALFGQRSTSDDTGRASRCAVFQVIGGPRIRPAGPRFNSRGASARPFPQPLREAVGTYREHEGLAT